MYEWELLVLAAIPVHVLADDKDDAVRQAREQWRSLAKEAGEYDSVQVLNVRKSKN